MAKAGLETRSRVLKAMGFDFGAGCVERRYYARYVGGLETFRVHYRSMHRWNRLQKAGLDARYLDQRTEDAERVSGVGIEGRRQ